MLTFKPKARPLWTQLTFPLQLVFLCMLINYSQWQNARPERNPIPFSDGQFFQDLWLTPSMLFSTPFTYATLIVICLFLIYQYYLKQRQLVISTNELAWYVKRYLIRTIVHLDHIQSIEYIAIPPQNDSQLTLLRFHCSKQVHDLDLSQFSPNTQAEIRHHLKQHFPYMHHQK